MDVVLPQPFGPSRPTTEPRAIDRSSPRRAYTGFFSFSTNIMWTLWKRISSGCEPASTVPADKSGIVVIVVIALLLEAIQQPIQLVHLESDNPVFDRAPIV